MQIGKSRQNRRPEIPTLDSLEEKAVVYLDKGKLRAAEGVFKKMLEIDSNSLAAHFHLARVYRRLVDYKKAKHHALLTLTLEPQERNANLNLALIYDEMGHFKQAIKFYKRELETNPDSAETHWNLGRLYFRMRRWHSAIKSLKRCYDLGFRFELEDTVNKLALCYKERREVGNYILLLERYVRTNVNAGWAFINLGRAYMFKKDYRQALSKLLVAQSLGAGKKVEDEIKLAKKYTECKT